MNKFICLFQICTFHLVVSIHMYIYIYVSVDSIRIIKKIISHNSNNPQLAHLNLILNEPIQHITIEYPNTKVKLKFSFIGVCFQFPLSSKHRKGWPIFSKFYVTLSNTFWRYFGTSCRYNTKCFQWTRFNYFCVWVCLLLDFCT